MLLNLVLILKLSVVGQPLEERSSFQTSLCDERVHIESPKQLRFTATETRFLCGDSELKEWSGLPPEQVKIHLRAALQSRGYHFPEIESRETKLNVKTGPITKIKKIEILGFSEPSELEIYLLALRKPLTPQWLDAIQAWMKNRLAVLGYPCAELKIHGNPESGIVSVFVSANGLRTLSELHENPIKDLEPGVLRRFDAFSLGQQFNARLLDLSSRRIERDGIAQSHYFSLHCSSEDKGSITIEEKTLLGPPRLFRIGIGADTEEYLIFQTSWKSARLDARGSSFLADLRASFKRQKLGFGMEWYPFSPPRRLYFHPSAQVERQSEDRYEQLNSDVKWLVGSSFDGPRSQLKWTIGPAFTDSRTLEGLGPNNLQYLSLETGIQWMTHRFEYFQSSPRDGFWVEFENSLLRESLLSPLSAYKFSLNGQALHNLFEFEPPLLILALRGGISTTETPLKTGERDKLPVRYRHFLGGIQSLRGFSREELPQEEVGALTAAFTGLELRTSYPIHPSFQPLVFIDAGLLGRRAFSLNMPLYWSPGLGARWQSPIGTFRATASQGFTWNETSDSPEDISHFQFYISFGKEF